MTKFDPSKIKVFSPASSFVMVSTTTGKIVVPGDPDFSDESPQNYVPVRYSGMIDKHGNMILDGDVLTDDSIVFFDVNRGSWRSGYDPDDFTDSFPLWSELKFYNLKRRSWEVVDSE